MPLSTAEAFKRIQAALKGLRMTHQEFLDRAGLTWDTSKLSAHFRDPKKAVSDSDRNRLIDFLADYSLTTQTDWTVKSLDGSPDYMYFSFLRYLGYHSETEQETKKLAEGIYRLFRPSLKLPDMFTMGLFEISRDKETDALCVRELRKFNPVVITAEDRANAAHDPDLRRKVRLEHERPIREDFVGYMVRKRRRYVCLQRAKAKDNPNFVFTVFNDEFIAGEDNARIQSLGGVSFGTRGSRVYVSRVFIERVEDDLTANEVEKTLDYIQDYQIKPSVLEYLKMPPASPYFQVF